MNSRFLLYLPYESYSPKGSYLTEILAPITFTYNFKAFINGPKALINGPKTPTTRATITFYPARLIYNRRHYNYYGRKL